MKNAAKPVKKGKKLESTKLGQITPLTGRVRPLSKKGLASIAPLTELIRPLNKPF